MYKRICGIDLEIEKKDIKNLHLYILPPDGRVKITAPRRMSERFVRWCMRVCGGTRKTNEHRRFQAHQDLDEALEEAEKSNVTHSA